MAAPFELENFKNDIRQWDEINNEIKEVEEGLKKLRVKKKEFQERSIIFMKQQEIDACNLGDGKAILKKSKSKVSCTTKSAIHEKIKSYFIKSENMDENIAENRTTKIIDFIYSDPEYKESFILSRTYKKGKTCE